MATGPITQISDVIVPEIFTAYSIKETETKSRIIQSGAMVRDPLIDNHLAGPGLTFNAPSYRDLDDDEENTSQDDADDRYTGQNNNSQPHKIGTFSELAVRMSRNNSWSTADLASALIGNDPQAAIRALVSTYWSRRLQTATVATLRGIFANNSATTVNGTGDQDDMSNDISDGGTTAGVYQAGVTDFSSPAFIDATATMGDSMEGLGLVIVHSLVYARMQKNRLIEYEVDPITNNRIPTYLGRSVVVDDGIPSNNGVYETWMFGGGALRFGASSPKVPTETKRDPDAGKGGGAEILYNRVEWCIHPSGYRYAGSAADGGPVNSGTVNNLAHPDSWERVYPERKQIKIARLVTRES